MIAFRLWFILGAAFGLRAGFLGVVHHATPIAPNVSFWTGLWAAALLIILGLMSRFGIPFMNRLGARWNPLFIALLMFTAVTKGWAVNLLSAWLCLLYLWDSWRDGDHRGSRARAAADRWKRRLLERFRNEAPTPIPVPS